MEYKFNIYSVHSLRENADVVVNYAFSLAEQLINNGSEVLVINGNFFGLSILDDELMQKYDIKISKQTSNLLDFFVDKHLRSKQTVRQFLEESFDFEGGKIHVIDSSLVVKWKPGYYCSTDGIGDNLYNYWYYKLINEISEEFEKMSFSDNVSIVLVNMCGVGPFTKNLISHVHDYGPERVHIKLLKSRDSDESAIDMLTNMMRSELEDDEHCYYQNEYELAQKWKESAGKYIEVIELNSK